MRLPQSFVFAPTGGVFMDVPLTSAIAFAPEVVYVKRGIDTKYIHYPTGAMAASFGIDVASETLVSAVCGSGSGGRDVPVRGNPS